MTELFSGDGRAHVNEFFPKDTTIRAGDTVVWGSTYFHSVTFSPTLPPTVNESSVQAKLNDGVLTITLNKREETKPRKISVS